MNIIILNYFTRPPDQHTHIHDQHTHIRTPTSTCTQSIHTHTHLHDQHTYIYAHTQTHTRSVHAHTGRIHTYIQKVIHILKKNNLKTVFLHFDLIHNGAKRTQ